MSWQQPKTDWTALDLFNIEDYNRIKGNLEYLHEKAQKLYREFSAEDMGEEKADYSAYFYADEFNAFESNICKAFSDAFKTGDFSNIGRFISDNLTKALNSIEWEKVYEGAKFFGRGLATFLNERIYCI